MLRDAGKTGNWVLHSTAEGPKMVKPSAGSGGGNGGTGGQRSSQRPPRTAAAAEEPPVPAVSLPRRPPASGDEG